VYDAAGRRIETLAFEGISGTFQTELDLRHLPQGIYTLRLTDGERVGALRLSIVR
jgi:hypothetical protein